MASYVNKKERVFCPVPDPQQCPPCELDTTRMRVQGRMKNYDSCLDIRAWHLKDQRRREHLLESINSGGCYPLGQVIPVSLLIKSLCPEIKLKPVCAAVEDYKKKHPEMNFDEDEADGEEEKMDTSELQDTIKKLKRKMKEMEQELVEKTKIAVEAVRNLEALHNSLLSKEDLVTELSRSSELIRTLRNDSIGAMAGISDKDLPSPRPNVPLKVIQMQEESKTMKEELQVLRACCDCMSGVKGEAETLRAERDALREELEALRAKQTDGKVSGTGKCFNLQTENEMLRANNEHLEKQVHDMEEHMKKMCAEMRELEKKGGTSKPSQPASSSKAIAKELKQVSEERDRLREHLDRVENMSGPLAEYKKRAKEADRLDQERCRLQSEVNELKALLEEERSNGRQVTDALKKESEVTRSEAKAGASNVADLEMELAYLRPIAEKYEACQRDCEMYASGLKQMMTERENFLHEISNLNKEIKNINERNSEMVNEYERMQVRTSEGFLKLRQEIEIKDDMIEMLREQICEFDPLQEELSTLQAQLVECIKVIDELQPSKDAILNIEARVGQIIEKLRTCNETFHDDVMNQVIKQLSELTNLKHQKEVLKSQVETLNNQLQYKNLTLNELQDGPPPKSDRKRFVQNRIEMERCKLYDMASPEAIEIAENLQLYVQELNYVYGNCDTMREMLVKTQEQLDEEGFKEEALRTLLCFEKNKLREVMNEIDKLDKKLKISVMKLNNFYDGNMTVIAGMQCSLELSQRENAQLQFSIERDIERLQNECDQLQERFKGLSAKMIEEMKSLQNIIEGLQGEIKEKDKVIWAVKNDWHFQELYEKMVKAAEYLIRDMNKMDELRQTSKFQAERMENQQAELEERIQKLQNELALALIKPCVQTQATQTEEKETPSTISSTTTTTTRTTHTTDTVPTRGLEPESEAETSTTHSTHTNQSKPTDSYIIDEENDELKKMIEELRNFAEQNRNELLGIIANLQAQINDLKYVRATDVAETASNVSSMPSMEASGSVRGSMPGSIRESVVGSISGLGTVPGSTAGSILQVENTAPESNRVSVYNLGSSIKTLPESIHGSITGSIPGSIPGSMHESIIASESLPGSISVITPGQPTVSVQSESGSLATSQIASLTGSVSGIVPKLVQEVEPKPVQAEEPKPVQVEEPKPVQVEEPKPVQKAQPKPVPEAEPKPVQGAKSKLVHEAEPKPVHEVEPKPVEEAKPKPVHEAEPESSAVLKPSPVASPVSTTEPKVPVSMPVTEPIKSDASRGSTEIGGFVSLFDKTPEQIPIETASAISMESTQSKKSQMPCSEAEYKALKAKIAELQSKVDHLTFELDKANKALEDCEMKLSRVVNSSNKNLQSLRNQYERTSNDMLSKHNDSVGRLQQMHEEALANQALEYEQQIENLKRQLDDLLNTRRPSSLSYTKTGDIMIQPEKEVMKEPEKVKETSKELIRSEEKEKDVANIKPSTPVESVPHKPCLCKKLPIKASASMLKLLHKMLYEGPETLRMSELEFLHTKTLKWARDIREKERLSKLSEEEKMVERIKKMEEDLMQKQLTAQEKLIELSEVVKEERLRLQTVRGTYGTEPNLIEDFSRQQQTRICRAATEITSYVPEKEKCACPVCSVAVAAKKTRPITPKEPLEKCICKPSTHLCKGSICPADLVASSKEQVRTSSRSTSRSKSPSYSCTTSKKRKSKT